MNKKEKINKMSELLKELLDHVWENAGFKDARGRLCDCDVKFRQGNDPVRLANWNKFHRISNEYHKIK